MGNFAEWLLLSEAKFIAPETNPNSLWDKSQWQFNVNGKTQIGKLIDFYPDADNIFRVQTRDGVQDISPEEIVGVQATPSDMFHKRSERNRNNSAYNQQQYVDRERQLRHLNMYAPNSASRKNMPYDPTMRTKGSKPIKYTDFERGLE